MLELYEQAEARLLEALAAQEIEMGPENIAAAMSHWLIGLCRWRSGNPEAGRESMRRSSEILLAVEGGDGFLHRFTRAQFLAEEDKTEDAERDLWAALAAGLKPWTATLFLRLHPRSNEPAFRRLAEVVEQGG
jgi:hypothetical protein